MKIRRKIYGTVFAILCLGIIPTFTYGVFDSTGYYYYADTNSYNTNGSYGYQVGSNGNLTTSFGDSDKKVFYREFGYDNGVKTILAWNNGKLYFMGGWSNELKTQGYIENFCVKEKNTRGENNLHDNCIYDTPLETILQANPTFTDYAFEIYGSNTPTWGYGNNPLQFCFSDGTYDYCASCSAYYQIHDYGEGPCASGLTGTLNITATDYETITNYNWGNSPIAGGGNSGGGGQGIPVVNVSCPTIQQLINSYQEQYQPGLCYSSEKIWSGNGFVSLTPKTIFELYPNYTGFAQDINTYYNYCNNSVSTATTCQQAFAGKEEQYTLISKIPNNVNDVKLYQYCHLELNYENKNITVCVDSGAGTNPTIPIESIIDEIVRKPRQITLPGNTEQNGSGNITGNNIFSDIVNGEDIEGIGDVINSLQSVYNKLTGLFYRRSGVDGIIPDIIVRILLLIILFKIFKK